MGSSGGDGSGVGEGTSAVGPDGGGSARHAGGGNGKAGVGPVLLGSIAHGSPDDPLGAERRYRSDQFFSNRSWAQPSGTLPSCSPPHPRTQQRRSHCTTLRPNHGSSAAASEAERQRRAMSGAGYDYRDGGNGDPLAQSPCDRLSCEELLQQWPVEKLSGRAIVQPLDTEVRQTT